MSELGSSSPEPTLGRRARVRVVFFGAVAAALIVVSVLATVGDARSPGARPAKAAPTFLQACTQRRGPAESVGDLNIKLKTSCAKGQKPLKLALYPVQGTQGPQGPQGPPGPQGPAGGGLGSAGGAGGVLTDYAVANVLVNRGSLQPRIWATYSAAMGSPVGTTVGGQLRFSCSTDQAPCSVSVAAAQLSAQTGTALVYARVLIYKDTGNGAENYCEYADSSTNSGTPARIDQVPLDTRVTAINDPLPMGIGGSLDCGSTQQSSTGIVKAIEVPAAPDGGPAYYDVWASFTFK